MSRGNIPLLSFNRGLISPKSLGRVDIDRTRLSAEVCSNLVLKTQGAMTIRPGTQYFGGSYNDTGAQWIEFVASTDDTALLELTHEKMRVWLGADSHSLALLGRPAVATTVDLTDTGWDDISSGGALAAGTSQVIPKMTAASTNGVTITASSEDLVSVFETGSAAAWKAADNNELTMWHDTGPGGASVLPSWWNVDFGDGVSQSIIAYSIKAGPFSTSTDNAPSAWRLLSSNFDTGTFATDTGKWTLEDERSAQTGWSPGETRSFTTPEGDTGTVDATRHWRLFFTSIDGDTELNIAEIDMFVDATSSQVDFQSGVLTLDAQARGSRAIVEKRVVVDTGDVSVEHSLAIDVERGPVLLRVGSTSGSDDYIRETQIGAGYHNLAFTPSGDFYIRLRNDQPVDRIVNSLTIGDSGTVEITAPWQSADLDNVRYDQSADVVYVDCQGVHPKKIERRGTGRSWSIVDFLAQNGPLLPAPTSSANLTVDTYREGNGIMTSDIPFFDPGHVGALFSLFAPGQRSAFVLGNTDAVTDPIEVTGINDTGMNDANSDRRIVFSVFGTYSGRITIERSFDSPDFGFKAITSDIGTASDTGTFTKTLFDPDDNIKVYYRARLSTWTSGAAEVAVFYPSGSKTGIARITKFTNSQNVSYETLTGFSVRNDTGETDVWQEGYWSELRGYPTAPALHGGRLAHAGGANLFMSVSDDFENFDATTIGDAGPIVRTLGSGPVDNIYYLISLLRLIVGTAGAEITVKSSSLDEPLTPTNATASAFSTQGSANLRAMKMDTRAIFVQRSEQRVFMVGANVQGNAFGDYEGLELTLLVPDLLAQGVTSIAIQRQPDTRLHFALGDGTVAILTYEPTEEVIAWSTWSSDTGTDSFVERVMTLPGVKEDAVYYHIRRTINGVTRRYLEKWAMESECLGDTGLSWLADCAVSISDTGRSTTFADAAEHLAGQTVIAWGDLDTGSTPYVDLSPDVSGVQTLHSVDTGGDLTLTGLTEGINQGVIGLPYRADWKSTKLAYLAQGGTALNQRKRPVQVGLILHQTHAKGLEVGADTGHLDDLPSMIDEGAVVDVDKIFGQFDQVTWPINGTYNTDSRVHIRATAPRPATVLAAIVNLDVKEKV